MLIAVYTYYITDVIYACYFGEHHMFVDLEPNPNKLTADYIVDGFFAALDSVIVEYDIHYGEEYNAT